MLQRRVQKHNSYLLTVPPHRLHGDGSGTVHPRPQFRPWPWGGSVRSSRPRIVDVLTRGTSSELQNHTCTSTNGGEARFSFKWPLTSLKFQIFYRLTETFRLFCSFGCFWILFMIVNDKKSLTNSTAASRYRGSTFCTCHRAGGGASGCPATRGQSRSADERRDTSGRRAVNCPLK